MSKPTAGFFLMDLALLVAGIALIFAVFELSGYFFILQLVMLLVFLGILTLGMAGAFNNQKNGWIMIAAALILVILDIVFMFLMSGRFSLASFIALIFSIIGLVISIASIAEGSEPSQSVSSHDEGYYNGVSPSPTTIVHQNVVHKVDTHSMKKELKEEVKKELADEIQKEDHVEKSFVPGKYIASRKANKYHSPKCDWAGRIKRGNEIWFMSKEEAEKNGFEADSCV